MLNSRVRTVHRWWQVADVVFPLGMHVVVFKDCSQELKWFVSLRPPVKSKLKVSGNFHDFVVVVSHPSNTVIKRPL